MSLLTHSAIQVQKHQSIKLPKKNNFYIGYSPFVGIIWIFIENAIGFFWILLDNFFVDHVLTYKDQVSSLFYILGQIQDLCTL